MLRDYQKKSIELIRNEFKNGVKKTCLVLPTGAGKSVVACEIIKSAISNSKRVIFVVRGVSLIDQISKRLFREEVEHGVIQSGHWNYRPNVTTQVISIDTSIARNLFPSADLIIIDECDQATSEGYKKFISQYPKAFILGITATPYSDKSLRHIADTVVVPITMKELIDQNFLVPFRCFAPSAPDLSNVKVSSTTKDYVSTQLENAMVAGGLTGKVIDHYKSLAADRPTLLFAVNVHHSKTLVDRFNAEGIAAEHADAHTPNEKRNSIFERLQSRETKVVCNVGIATRGFDAPFVSCLILARPTKSLNLHIQMLGRGTRLSPGKKDCLVLDHAGNFYALGFPTDNIEINLDGTKFKEKIVQSKICQDCFCVYRGSVCPECGVKPPAPEREEIKLEETDEELVEITEGNPIQREWMRLQREAKKTGKKPAWAMYKIVYKYGLDNTAHLLPYWFVTKFKEDNEKLLRNSPIPGKF